MIQKTLKWGVVRLAAVLVGLGVAQTVAAADLPADYTRLDYIESTGTQWIDTGHTHTATTRVDCVVNIDQVQVKDAAAVFGSFNGSKAANNFCFFSTFGMYNGDRPGYGRTGVETYGRGLFLGEKIRLVCEGLTAKWWAVSDPAREGALYNTGTPDAGLCTLAIFNIHNMTQVQGNAWELMKLYSFKIYEGETLMRDFVPVRDGNGVLGLYDLVQGEFKANSGTGTFLAGEFAPITGANFTKTGADRTMTTGVNLSGALTLQEGALVARDVADAGAFTCGTLTLAGGTLDFAVRGEGTPEIKVAGAATVTGAVTVKAPESLAVGVYPIIAAGSFAVTGGSVTLDPACVKAGGTERRLETTAEGLRLVVSTPLPAGYTRLEYIESTGTQWIDTGYIHQANTRVECVIASHWQMDGSAHTYPVAFGSFNGSKNTSAFCFFTHWGTGWSGANKPATCRTGVETGGGGFFFDRPTRLICEGTNANWSLVEEPNRTGSITGGGTADAGVYSMYIFVIHDGAATTARNSFEMMRLYSFNISEGNATSGYTLKRSYIPALREADHAIGLYDTVTQTFTPDCSGGAVGFIGAYPDGILGVDYMKTGGDRVIANGVNLSGVLTLAGGTLAVAEAATQKIRCQTLALAGGTLDFATLGVGTPEIQVAGAATISGAVTVTLPPALAPGTYNLITAGSLTVAEGAAVTLAEGAAVGSDGATRTLEVTETGVRVVVGEQILPAGYTRLAGVRATGTQWIDTGFETYELTSIDFSYSDDSYVHATAFFGQDAWTGSRCLFNQQSNELYFHDTVGVLMGPAPGYGQRHRFLLGADARARPSTNGAEPAAFAVRNSFAGANRRLAIFGTTVGTYLTCYTFNEMRIADAGALKRYFVPCLSPHGEAGLWDFVEGRFYGRQGSGVLLPVYAGVEARLNYVQSNSHQCVLVDNYTMDANTTVLMNFAYPVYQQSTAFFGIGWSGNQYLFNQQSDLFTFHSGGQNLPTMGKPDATAKYQVEINNANAFVVRNLTAGTSASAAIVRTVPASPLAIFSINTGANASSFRFYDMEIGHAEGNGVVVQRRLFPARNGVGAVGLRDELTGAFYPNRGTEPLAYGYAYNTTEDGVVLYDGEIVAEDQFPTANVVKASAAAIKAGVVPAFLSLAVEEGVFDFADGTPRAAEVAGALTLAGGTRLRFDATDTGNDTLTAASVAFVNASAETPVAIELAVSGSVSFGEDGKMTLISGGLTAADAAKFKLEGLDGTLLVEGGALKATLPTDVVVSAVWTGGGDRTNLADTRNWQCRNVLGEPMPNQLPTADSYVIVGTNTTFNWPAGQTLTCRKVIFENEFKLNADCDWRGLAVPITFKVDLNGHKLYLSNLQGRGEITDSTRPCEYQRLEFIASTAAGQWIDTGYLMKAKTKFECAVDVSLNQPYTKNHGWPEIFGVINGQDRVVFFPTFGAVTDGALTSECCLNRGGDETKKGTFYNGEKMKLTVQGTNAYFESLEGTGHSGSVTGVPVTPGASQYTIFIFTAGKGGTTYDDRTCAMNLYSFKIWDDGDNADSLVRDFVPVRRTSDGAIGLLDLVNNEFHGNGNVATIAMKGGGALAGEIDCCGEVHLDVSEGLTIGTDAVKLTGSLRLVKEGLGTFHPTITGSTYYGGTEVAAGQMTAWQDAYPASADKTVTISSNAVFDIDGLWKDARGCASEAMYELNGGTIDNLGVDCSEAWGSMMNMRLTADSKIKVSHTYGFIAGSYMMTFIDLCNKKLTIDIADDKVFWLFDTSIYNGTLVAETPATGKLWFNKFAVRAYTAAFDLNCGIQIDVPVDVKNLTMRYAGTTASGGSTLTIHGTYKPVSDFIYNFKMLTGTKLDLTAQEGVFALTSPTTGKTLAFADDATIAVDMGTRRIPAEGRVVAWEDGVDKPTNNVTFVAPPGARYRVYTKDDGIYVMSGMIITIR